MGGQLSLVLGSRPWAGVLVGCAVFVWFYTLPNGVTFLSRIDSSSEKWSLSRLLLLVTYPGLPGWAFGLWEPSRFYLLSVCLTWKEWSWWLSHWKGGIERSWLQKDQCSFLWVMVSQKNILGVTETIFVCLFVLNLFFFFKCASVFRLDVCLYKGVKWLGAALQTVVSCHVCAGNLTSILRKHSQWVLLTTVLSFQPQRYFSTTLPDFNQRIRCLLSPLELFKNFLLLWSDTMTKATYKRKHLTGDLLTV